MTIQTKTEGDFVNDMVTAWAALIGQVPSLPSGDPLLASYQAFATQLNFLQVQILRVLALARAQTSTGADLDSWMAQFNFPRLGAVASTGPVTFSSNIPAASPVQIPAGLVTVQTAGGAIQFTVVGSTSEPTWNASLNAYVLAAGQSSLTAVVQCTVAGTVGNVAAGAIQQIATQLPGIDSVTNPSLIDNGLAAESDASYRARFIQYLASLGQATEAAIQAAAEGVQQGLTITLAENERPDFSTLLGAFTVFVDDGSGDPPTQLLNAVYAAVYAARAFTVQPFVAAAPTVTLPVVMPIRLAAGYLIGSVGPLVQSAIVVAMNGLSGGATVFISALIEATLAIQGVAAVEAASVTINGVAADYVPTGVTEPRTNTGSVTVSTY